MGDFLGDLLDDFRGDLLGDLRGDFQNDRAVYLNDSRRLVVRRVVFDGAA